jgi:glutamine synthetase
MFLQEGPHGTMILYIPSVFISYNGEALDEKSVLLRSSSVISKVALEILHLIEPIEDGKFNNFITINNNHQSMIGYIFWV